MICHVPHGSTMIPAKYESDFLISSEELRREAWRMADLFTEELYRLAFMKFGGIIARVSRIVADMERFERDEDEGMSRVGMGVLYTKTERGAVMRKISAERRQELLKEIYRPYHHVFTRMVKDRLLQNGRCLILDCHSFPSLPRRYEQEQKKNRPDICIGVDKFHTPAGLKKIFVTEFQRVGFSVKVNQPFSGAIVPRQFYKRNKNAYSVLVEVNRKLYMDEERFTKSRNFSQVAKKVTGALAVACQRFFQEERLK